MQSSPPPLPLVLLTSFSLLLVLARLPPQTAGQTVTNTTVVRPPTAQDIFVAGGNEAFAADSQEGQSRDKRLLNFGMPARKAIPVPRTNLETKPQAKDIEIIEDPLSSGVDDLVSKRETNGGEPGKGKRRRKKIGRPEKNEDAQENRKVSRSRSKTFPDRLEEEEHLETFDLGDPCDMSNSERVEEIFANSVPHDEIMDILLSLSERGGICDYRKFLVCRSGSCQYWSPGVVGVDPSGPKTTYIIGPDFMCGRYPKFYEDLVQLQCDGEEGEYCSRSNPKMCPHKPDKNLYSAAKKGRQSSQGHKKSEKQPHPKNSRYHQQKNRPRKTHRQMDNVENVTGSTEPFEEEVTEKPEVDNSENKSLLHYGQHCTSQGKCQARHMSCQTDHLVLRAHGEQAETGSLGRSGSEAAPDVLELDYYSGLPILNHGEPKADDALKESIYSDLELDYSAQNQEDAKVPRNHFLCRCDKEYAPFIKDNGHVMCRTAADWDCVHNKECASEHCFKDHCLIAKKFLFFVHIADHKLNLNTHPHDLEIEEEKDAGTGAGVDSGETPQENRESAKIEEADSALKLKGSQWCLIMATISILHIFWQI